MVIVDDQSTRCHPNVTVLSFHLSKIAIGDLIVDLKIIGNKISLDGIAKAGFFSTLFKGRNFTLYPVINALHIDYPKLPTACLTRPSSAPSILILCLIRELGAHNKMWRLQTGTTKTWLIFMLTENCEVLLRTTSSTGVLITFPTGLMQVVNLA